MFPDYQWSLKGLEGEALEAARRACHQRSADRMVALCGVNGGVYIKAGQHLGQMVRWHTLHNANTT